MKHIAFLGKNPNFLLTIGKRSGGGFIFLLEKRVGNKDLWRKLIDFQLGDVKI